eukprot:COSAG02_NODE_93_length_37477_cov_78.101129_2_plen_108_part_00
MAELEVWDETKENVMPIKGGRRMKKQLGLRAPKPSVEDERRCATVSPESRELSSVPSDRPLICARLYAHAVHRQFERDVIQSSTAPDPLDTWIKYVAVSWPTGWKSN